MLLQAIEAARSHNAVGIALRNAIRQYTLTGDVSKVFLPCISTQRANKHLQANPLLWRPQSMHALHQSLLPHLL